MFQIGVRRKIFACLRNVLFPLFHWNRFSFVAAAILFPGKQNHCACPSSLFSPGWNSVSITWDFFRFSGPFGRAENPSPVFQGFFFLGFLARAELRHGLNPSPRNRQFDFKRPSWPGWNSLCNQALTSDDFMFHSWHQSVSATTLRLRKV